MDSDDIQLWVPDMDGSMEPSEDRGYVTLEDHLDAVLAAVLAAVRAARIQECEACAQVCESAENEWGTQLQNGDVFASMLRGD